MSRARQLGSASSGRVPPGHTIANNGHWMIIRAPWSNWVASALWTAWSPSATIDGLLLRWDVCLEAVLDALGFTFRAIRSVYNHDHRRK